MDQKDLKQIGELINDNNKTLISLVDVKLNNFKNEITEELEVKMLNWKSEIVDSVDVLAKEIRDEREFREIASHQISELDRKVGGVRRSGV